MHRKRVGASSNLDSYACTPYCTPTTGTSHLGTVPLPFLSQSRLSQTLAGTSDG